MSYEEEVAAKYADCVKWSEGLELREEGFSTLDWCCAVTGRRFRDLYFHLGDEEDPYDVGSWYESEREWLFEPFNHDWLAATNNKRPPRKLVPRAEE